MRRLPLVELSMSSNLKQRGQNFIYYKRNHQFISLTSDRRLVYILQRAHQCWLGLWPLVLSWGGSCALWGWFHLNLASSSAYWISFPEGAASTNYWDSTSGSSYLARVSASWELSISIFTHKSRGLELADQFAKTNQHLGTDLSLSSKRIDDPEGKFVLIGQKTKRNSCRRIIFKYFEHPLKILDIVRITPIGQKISHLLHVRLIDNNWVEGCSYLIHKERLVKIAINVSAKWCP